MPHTSLTPNLHRGFEFPCSYTDNTTAATHREIRTNKDHPLLTQKYRGDRRPMALLTTEGLHKALCGPTIAIEVGEGDSKASFQIFEGILCQFEWFACALKEGRFKEGEERQIKLPKTSPQTFKYFQYYSYSGKIDCIDHGLISNEDHLREHVKHLVELWIFGDAYGVTDLQIPSVFELRRLLNWAYTKSPVCIIFAEFIVMRIEEFKDPESDYEFLGQYPGFITELYQAKGSGVGEGAEGRYKLYRNQDA
ncbi:hypothetical protein KC349_g3060 [Hortaea werneckii]|nr:hypothetical protein KC349_g3060 [Hortaea werneckii]